MVYRKMRDNRSSILLLICLLVVIQAGPLLAFSSQAREYLRRAEVFFENGNLVQARNFFQRAEKIDPDDAKIKEFAAKLNKVITERADRLQLQIEFYLSAKNVPEAEKNLHELLSLSPENEFALSKMKQVSETYKKIDEYRSQGINIEVSSGRAHDVDLYSAVSYMNRARGFFDQGDRAKALEMLAVILTREKDYKPALELKARIDHINQIESFVEKAETAFLEGRMMETTDALTVLIADSPDRIEYLLLRGKAHLKLKNYDEALTDFWKYFRKNADKDTLFPLFSECYFGQRNYLMALGFSRNAKTGKVYQTLAYRVECHFRMHFVAYMLLLLLLLLFPVAIYYSWKAGEDLLMRFSMGTLRVSIKCVAVIAVKSPVDCLGDLISVARDLNVPWLNYLVGICLFKIGQIEGAQRFLTYSLESGSLRSRAYYFVGLARKFLKHQSSESDFEESVLSGVGRQSAGWHPKFMKQIERELLMSYSKEKGDETFEGMAFALVEAQTEE
jgi:tetratricopeptide (TPR) repeat protein